MKISRVLVSLSMMSTASCGGGEVQAPIAREPAPPPVQVAAPASAPPVEAHVDAPSEAAAKKPVESQLSDLHVVLDATLGASEILTVVRAHAKEIRQACWDHSALDKESLSIRLVIGPSGAVQESTARNGSDSAIDQCVEQAIKTWTFPAATGPTHVSIPFRFVR